jgi:hypothetical protein
MFIRLFLITAAAFAPVHSFSKEPDSVSTEIPGIELWNLDFMEPNKLTGGIEGESEIIQHCNGESRSVYIGSSKTPIPCKSITLGIYYHDLVLTTKDKSLSGLVVISKKSPLPDRFKPIPLSADEIERVRKAEIDLKADFAAEARAWYGANSAAYEEMLGYVTTKATYRKHWGARYKLPGLNGTLYISALGLSPDQIGWNIRYAVLQEKEGRIEKIGEITGCIDGFRDLDEDGIPEILASTCENSEGTSTEYWSLVRTVRPVVRLFH